MKKNKFLIFLIILLLSALTISISVTVYTPLNNPQVKGWLFGKDSTFVFERVWATTGTVDTVLIPNLDTLCAVFLQPKTTQIENLFADIQSGGDTLFVTSDSAGTATTDKYFIMVVRNAYNASD